MKSVFYGKDIPYLFNVNEYRPDLRNVEPGKLYTVSSARQHEGRLTVKFTEVSLMGPKTDFLKRVRIELAQGLLEALRKDEAAAGEAGSLPMDRRQLRWIGDVLEDLIKEAAAS